MDYIVKSSMMGHFLESHMEVFGHRLSERMHVNYVME